MKFIGPQDTFPPVESADSDGLLAFGGDLSPERLLEAYARGIFPWYDRTQPILWWSPDPRMVLFPGDLKISKSMRKILKTGIFQVTFNANFSEVIDACAKVPRKGQQGTWITPEMQQAYQKLHDLGIAQSLEVWQDDELVGGLYGIYLKEKKVFCGESMFTTKSNASKFGFVQLVRKLQKEDTRIIDCQVYTEHLASLGAREISRREFLQFLK